MPFAICPMIHISLSPNLELNDVSTALKRLILFWRWNSITEVEKFEKQFKNYFNSSSVYLFNSGRSALLTALNALNLKEGDEVIIQAFTCNAVANPIRWAGAKPVYVDIDESYNIDPALLEEKITPRTKAIIVQHTFGIVARLDEILAIAQKHNTPVIEDCAHALGAGYKGKKVGSLGDIAFFSFGRDKVISSVYGGALMINNPRLREAVEKEYEHVPSPSFFWTFQQLLHPPITYVVLKTYRFGGKYLLWIAQKLHLLSYAVTRGERRGKKPAYFAARLPGALAYLARIQFNKLERLNEHRKMLAGIYRAGLQQNKAFTLVENYDEGSIFLRYPVMHQEATNIIEAAQKQGVILGDWYRGVIAPMGTHREIMGYDVGSCQRAENNSAHVINLPTNIRTSAQEAKKIISFLNLWN